MSVQCPAPECDFTATLDAVQGHVGGAGDQLHKGVVPPDVRRSAQESSDATKRIGLLVALGVALLLLSWATSTSEAEASERPSEETEAAGRVVPA